MAISARSSAACCRRFRNDPPSPRLRRTSPLRSVTELFDLSGRVAIVTGGSRGLGEEMAQGLAEAGASLMLCARREQWLTPTLESFRSRGFKVEGMICDVADAEQVQAVVDKTIAAFGKIVTGGSRGVGEEMGPGLAEK